MGDEFVSRTECSFGSLGKIEDMKNFSKLKLTHRKMVQLMKKTGFCKVTPRHSFSIDYVIPAGVRIDFASVEKDSFIVAMDDGSSLNYNGVFCMEEGDEKYDGENESVVTFTFGATNMVVKQG